MWMPVRLHQPGCETNQSHPVLSSAISMRKASRYLSLSTSVVWCAASIEKHGGSPRKLRRIETDGTGSTGSYLSDTDTGETPVSGSPGQLSDPGLPMIGLR